MNEKKEKRDKHERKIQQLFLYRRRASKNPLYFSNISWHF